MSDSTAVQHPRACHYCCKPEHGSIACNAAPDWPQRGESGTDDERANFEAWFGSRYSSRVCESKHLRDEHFETWQAARATPSTRTGERGRKA